MELVGALNRVFEKVLGIKTADSKKLLDDYIGGGGGESGGSSERFIVNISLTDDSSEFPNGFTGQEYCSLDKTTAEIMEAINQGKQVIGVYEATWNDGLGESSIYQESPLVSFMHLRSPVEHYRIAFSTPDADVLGMETLACFYGDLDGYPNCIEPEANSI